MAEWNPLHDLVTLQDRMNRLFEDATHRRAGEAEVNGLEKTDWCPAADVYESENEFTVTIDLPGIDRSVLDISLDESRLSVKGSRPRPNPTQHRAECPYGSFLRTFTVPGSVEQSKISAGYKDGVLTVHLPKRNEPNAGRIEIKVS